jgi:Uma2 family endonuclease
MSRATTTIEPRYPTDPVFPLSVEQYHTMIETGVLTDDDPVELIEGVLVFHMPKSPAHEFVIDAAQEQVRRILPEGWTLRVQAPLTFVDGEPEPDLAIVRGSRRDYVSGHPSGSDAAIVMEISDSTLRRDRGAKLRSYARAGIGEYWIVNLESRAIEVYTDPDVTAAEPGYRSRVDVPADGRVAVRLGGTAVGEIEVASILP